MEHSCKLMPSFIYRILRKVSDSVNVSRVHNRISTVQFCRFLWQRVIDVKLDHLFYIVEIICMVYCYLRALKFIKQHLQTVCSEVDLLPSPWEKEIFSYISTLSPHPRNDKILKLEHSTCTHKSTRIYNIEL